MQVTELQLSRRGVMPIGTGDVEPHAREHRVLEHALAVDDLPALRLPVPPPGEPDSSDAPAREVCSDRL